MSIEPESAQLSEDDFQQIVDSLKYEAVASISQQNLSDVLQKHNSTFNINRLKNELFRLSEKCQQPLDFRWKIQGLEAEQVDILGVTHFLDDKSIKFLIEEIKRYKMVYTVGAFEATKRFFEKNKNELLKSQQALKTNIKVVKLCKEYMRGEERMYFAKAVTISPLSENTVKQGFVLTDNEKKGRLEGVTSNISKSALKIRSHHGFESGQYVAIRFDGLKNDLVFSQPNIIYKVIKVKRLIESNTFEYVLEIQETQLNAEFKRYLLNLIYSYKHKYKVDLGTTMDAVFAKNCEQHIIENSEALTLFFSSENQIEYCLVNQHSEKLEQYFDRTQKISLQRIFSDMDLVKRLRNSGNLFVLLAKGTSKLQSNNGGTILIAAVLETNNIEEFSSAFARYAQLKSTKLYKIQLSAINPAMAFRMSTVPTESQESYGSSRIHRYSRATKEAVASLTFQVSMTPVNVNLLKSVYADIRTDKKLAGTVIGYDNSKKGINLVKAEAQEQRSEDRFIFTTPVALKIDGKNLQANTNDISSLGLSINIPKHLRLPTNEFLNVTFLDYEQSSTLYNLSDCKYKVVSCKQGLLRLSNRMVSHHDGRDFLHKFILKRLDQLKVSGRKAEHVGFSRSLANLTLGKFADQVLLYKTDINRPIVTTVVDNSVKHGMEENLVDNLRRWFYDDNVYSGMQRMVSKLADGTDNQVCWVLINLKENVNFDRVESAFIMHSKCLEADLAGIAELNQHKINTGTQRVFQLSFSASENLKNRYLADELKYVNRYAPHKYAELSDAMSEIKGTVVKTDISQVVLALLSSDKPLS